MERARRGDRDAFGELAAADIGRLFAIAQLILGAPELARDAVQDALLEAWRGLPRLRDVDRYDAWQHRLLVRSCQRQRGRRARVAGSWEVERVSADSADPADSIVTRDQIARAFHRLPAEQRAVLVLKFYLDLPVRDVATQLGLPEGTVKSRLHRGLSALRAALEADARDPRPLAEGSVQ
ncbi:MAG: sigma-70 family RNA polymerase sigma factor [Chloroflexota bacterium]